MTILEVYEKYKHLDDFMSNRELIMTEVRSWSTKYRGPLLIVASKTWDGQSGYFHRKGLPYGQALSIANLVDCRPMCEADKGMARCDFVPGYWSWVLADVKPIEPFQVKGQLGLFEMEVPT